MDIVGYADRYSVRAGDTIRFMVSSKLPSYQADIVRLIHGDVNPEGPGFKEEPVQAVGTLEGPVPGAGARFVRRRPGQPAPSVQGELHAAGLDLFDNPVQVLAGHSDQVVGFRRPPDTA